jgi:hypothetical protein
MKSPSKFVRFLERFDIALRRLGGIVFAVMGLAWIGTILEGIRTANRAEVAFASLSMAGFLALSWLYLSGPLSGAARRRRG